MFLEYEESDGTQMNKFSSFFFKLRHHTSILKNPDTKELAKKIRNKAVMTMIRTPNKSVQFFVQIFFLTHVFLIRDIKGLNWYASYYSFPYLYWSGFTNILPIHKKDNVFQLVLGINVSVPRANTSPFILDARVIHYSN